MIQLLNPAVVARRKVRGKRKKINCRAMIKRLRKRDGGPWCHYCKVRLIERRFVAAIQSGAYPDTRKMRFAALALQQGARLATIDHKTPLSTGGTNELANLVLSCPPCNNTKRSKTYTEFMAVQQ